MEESAVAEDSPRSIDGGAPGGDSAPTFVSYASADSAVANALVETLERHAMPCWIAPRDVKAGALYAEAIVRAISSARAMVLVLSENSIRSTHVGKELERASSKRRPVIALRIDAAPLTPAFEYFLSESQWIDVQSGNMEPAYAKLIAAMRNIPGPVHPGGAPAAAMRAATAPPRQGRRKWILAAAVVAVVCIAALLAIRSRQASPLVAKQPPPSAASAVSGNSVAVLPFVDLSEKRDQEYFSDGLSDELIAQLGRVPDLHVPARTSSFYFKGRNSPIAEIGKTLGVAHVLEGSVRKAGDTVRITAELIEVGSDSHLWSETFDRKLDDIFKIQDEIAAAVVQHLRLALAGGSAQRGATTNSQAYNLYLQARHLAMSENTEDLNKAVVLYEQAIALDPNFALAYAWLADCHTRRVANGLDTDGVGFAKTKAAAERAIALDPNLPDGYVKLGVAHLQFDMDWTTDAPMIQKGLALDAGNPQALEASGHLAIATGTLAEAESYFRRAIDHDPLNLQYRRYLGRALYYQDRLAEAETVLRRIIELDPKVTVAHYELGRVLLARGDTQGALAAFSAESGAAWKAFGKPLIYYAMNRPQDAQAALDVLLSQSAGSEFQIAEAYAYMGQKDRAFDWLEHARTRHDPGILWIRHDPLLRSLTADPRYKAVLASLKLAE